MLIVYRVHPRHQNLVNSLAESLKYIEIVLVVVVTQ